MQQYVTFNVLKEYCIPKEEEEEFSVIPMQNVVCCIVLSYSEVNYIVKYTLMHVIMNANVNNISWFILFCTTIEGCVPNALYIKQLWCHITILGQYTLKWLM